MSLVVVPLGLIHFGASLVVVVESFYEALLVGVWHFRLVAQQACHVLHPALKREVFRRGTTRRWSTIGLGLFVMAGLGAWFSPFRSHRFWLLTPDGSTWSFCRRGRRFGFRGFPFGHPPRLAFSRAALAFAGLVMLPSIAAALIGFPQCGQFICIRAPLLPTTQLRQRDFRG